jgi:hypothetical protein
VARLGSDISLGPLQAIARNIEMRVPDRNGGIELHTSATFLCRSTSRSRARMTTRGTLSPAQYPALPLVDIELARSCSLTQSRPLDQFSNLIRFRGTRIVPLLLMRLLPRIHMHSWQYPLSQVTASGAIATATSAASSATHSQPRHALPFGNSSAIGDGCASLSPSLCAWCSFSRCV